MNIPLFHPMIRIPHIDEIFQVSIKIQKTEICLANNKMEILCARRRNVRKECKIHTKSINSDIDIEEKINRGYMRIKSRHAT